MVGGKLPVTGNLIKKYLFVFKPNGNLGCLPIHISAIVAIISRTSSIA
jgi:hypothetical protein